MVWGVLLWAEWSENASLRRWPQRGPGDKAPVCRVQAKSIPERERGWQWRQDGVWDSTTAKTAGRGEGHKEAHAERGWFRFTRKVRVLGGGVLLQRKNTTVQTQNWVWSWVLEWKKLNQSQISKKWTNITVPRNYFDEPPHTPLSSFPQRFWHSENEILGFHCTPEGCHRQVSGSARFKAYFPSTVEYQRRRCPRGDTPSVPTPSWCNTGHVGTVGRGNVLEAIIILGGLTIPSLHMAGTADKYAHGSHDVPRSKRKGTDSSTSQLQLEDLTLANITQSTRAYEPIVRVPPGPWKALCKWGVPNLVSFTS